MRNRVAFVVPRYGVEVNGGAELSCRVLAEHMQKHWEVEVLTSCARDYVYRFENDYEEGIEVVNGVKVVRFRIDHLRSEPEVFARLDQKVRRRAATAEEEQLWLKEIGPYSSSMIEFIADHHPEYDLFTFVTSLYATTTLVLPLVRDKAVLLPNAHDEPPIHARCFDDFFGLPRMLVLSTEPEKEFLEGRSRSPLPPSVIAGVGFDYPSVEKIDEMRAKGRNYARSMYSWDAVESQFQKVLAEVSRQPRRKRVAFIAQRCGREVNGGAEALCLRIAQRMAAYWNTEVLTTCALDYVSWKDHFPPGVELIDGALVRRFPVALPREPETFDRMSSELHPRGATATLEEQERWMREQGPWSPELFSFIEAHAGDYDAFIFFTYLYAPTWFALPKVADKAILVPCAHDEWTIYLNMWDRLFALPRVFVFNTAEERDFLRRRFPASPLEGPVAGVVVDRPADIDPARFRHEYGIDEWFLLYVGRIDPSKGCDEMFDFFIRHREAGNGPEKLVLLGKTVMPIPDHPDIISLGFVSEQTKWDALAACDALVMPSPHESLSIVLLEAWSAGKPVVVNGRCDVLVGQCSRANGGLWYRSFEEFTQCVTCLREGRNAGALGRQGWHFVRDHYSWPLIEQAYLDAVDTVASTHSSFARGVRDELE